MKWRNLDICSFKQNIKPLCFSSLLFFLTSSISLTAYAFPIDPHGYAQQYKSVRNHGGFFSSTNVQDDLYTLWSNTNTGGSINKEMWIAFNDNDWIEVGDLDGAVAKDISISNPLGVDQSQWSGHFLSYKFKNSSGNIEYHETAYGAEFPTGTHNYSISYIGSNPSPTWVIYTDYARTLTITPVPYTSAQGMMVGIETKDDTNNFRNNTYVSGMQGKDIYDNWNGWSDQSPTYKKDYNTNNVKYGPWSSSFYYDTSSGGSSINFSHQ